MSRLDELLGRHYGVKGPPLAPDEKEELQSLQASQRNKRNRGRGYYGEAKLAKQTGGIVVGRSKYIAGIKIDHKNPPDVISPISNPMFSFECKRWKQAPKSIIKLMRQAVTNAPESLIPVGVIQDRSDRESYVLMRMRDWIDLHVGEGGVT